MTLPIRAASIIGAAMWRFLPCWFASLLLFSVFCMARADTVRTVSGDVLHGSGLRLTDGKVSLKSGALGAVKIPADKIRTVSSDGTLTLVFSNGARLNGRIVGVGETLMRVVGVNGAASTPFQMDSLRTITPPVATTKPIAPKWKTKGLVNFGFTSSSGNSDARQIHADGKLTARRAKNRYKVQAELNFRRENDEELANDALLKLKHDHFITKKWFFYTSAGFEHDTAKELNLRTDLGSGAGYQIVDTDRVAVSVEGGLSYVIDDFSEGDDGSYGAARWSADLRYDPVLKTLSLFHNHELLASVTSSDGIVARTRTGARYHMGNGLTASAQVKYDWDSDPAPGEVESDTTYYLTLGYAW